MEAHTQTHLKQLRELLEYRHAELRADVAANQENSADPQQASVRDAAQGLRDREELESVAAAIDRLDRGFYGDCIECEEPIAFERLFVQPAAVRCAPCQAKHEHAHRMTPSIVKPLSGDLDTSR